MEKMLAAAEKRLSERGHAQGIEGALRKDFPDELASMTEKHLGKSFSEALWIELGRPSNNQCGQCQTQTKFINFAMGYREYCSKACAMSNPERIQKAQATNLANHGGVHASKTPEYRSKFEKTMIARYGVAYTLMSPELKARAKSTIKSRYGVDNLGALVTTDSISKAKETRKNTMRARYGVDSALQCPEIFERGERTRRTAKTFNIGGKTFTVRGFEDTAIRHLIHNYGVSPTDIFTTASDGNETVWYEFEGRTRRYHPDMTIILSGRRVVVEVKSVYTLGASERNPDKSVLEKNIAKWSATARQHEIILIVIGQKSTKAKDADPSKVFVIENPHLATRATLMEKTIGFK